jgi:glycosyltransferase involved in cell wall biosynthesis
MRIGINLLYLLPDVVGGTQTYAVSLINWLAKIDRVNEYFIFLNQESSLLELADAPNFHRIVCQFRAVRRVTRYLWEQVILPFQLRDYHVDLVHSLGYVGPLFAACPCIITIPDLNYIALRDFIPAGRRRVLQFFSTHAARRAAQVITISHFSKAEIARYIGLQPDKITVTHLGAGWTENSDDHGRYESIRMTYQLPDRYIAAFGGGSPHKNISRLISAFQTVARDFPQALVLLGHVPLDVDLPGLMQNAELSGRIMALGYVPREHIGPILSRADLFVLPSLYEGFGMTVLEAQASRVPVACAAAGSLPEVAGDGAIFFDPLSVNDMSQALRRCLANPDLSAALCLQGLQNVQRFSWENTAKATLEVYRRTHSRAASTRKS